MRLLFLTLNRPQRAQVLRQRALAQGLGQLVQAADWVLLFLTLVEACLTGPSHTTASTGHRAPNLQTVPPAGLLSPPVALPCSR